MESFKGKLRNELRNGEIFDTLLEAEVLTARWRKEYLPAGQAGNTIRHHNSLGYRLPAPENFYPRLVASA